jgi:hypothetical protein
VVSASDAEENTAAAVILPIDTERTVDLSKREVKIMKTFEDICKMTQNEVKTYMKSYLSSKKYHVIDEDGFLYAKGNVPVLLVAHMDTVHKEQCKNIISMNGKLSSPQGIGGDDRCGIFIIMNIVKELNCSVLLCEDEEIGGVGARKFTQATYKRNDESGNVIEEKYIEHLDVNYMIEFDRKGNSDAVFYSCDNKEFINFVEDATGFKFSHGSFSDISTLMPAAKLSAVNLSSGYYNAHTVGEYVVYDEMIDTMDAAKVLIKEKCDKPFEYVAKQYESYYRCGGQNYSGYKNYSGYRNYYYPTTDYHSNNYYGNLLDEPDGSPGERLADIARSDTDLELEAIVYDSNLCEKTIVVSGATKAECWMNLFLENTSLCFNDIVDYSWG